MAAMAANVLNLEFLYGMRGDNEKMINWAMNEGLIASTYVELRLKGIMLVMGTRGDVRNVGIM